MELFCFIATLLVLAENTVILSKLSKKKSFSSNQKRKIYVDTSALIDGRILSIAQTGFISDNLIIPRSVIRELQLLADGKDAEKRTRARFGMDTANELERVVYCDTIILQDELDRTPVDERLIELAKANHGLILTNDYNLGKVAATENIEVLNVNDLALVLRPEFLPGEKLTVKITSEGSNQGQGVGHLPDGTMVVVDNASKKIGLEVEIELIRFIQTSAGKMIFAKISNNPKQYKTSTVKVTNTGKPASKSTGRALINQTIKKQGSKVKSAEALKNQTQKAQNVEASKNQNTKTSKRQKTETVKKQSKKQPAKQAKRQVKSQKKEQAQKQNKESLSKKSLSKESLSKESK